MAQKRSLLRAPRNNGLTPVRDVALCGNNAHLSACLDTVSVFLELVAKSV
jgi:hypothetical protein